MTVKELIEILEKYPKDAYICYQSEIEQVEINKMQNFSFKGFIDYINID